MVILFHGKLGFPGGFVGVDVFFVISGYLITSIIVRDLESGTFSLAAFYDRRVRRILPPLITMIFLSILVGWLLLLPDDLTDLVKSALAQLGMLANVFFWRTTGYFEGPADQKPLLHMWSLAVEEQYYLLFPVSLMLLFQHSRKLTVFALLFITAISLALSIYGTEHHPSATYYLLPTRLWELSIGALLAFGKSWFPSSACWSRTLGIAGLTAIFLSGLFYTDQTPFPGINAAAPCFGACALIAAGHRNKCWPTRFLMAKPLVAVGLISYSLYLWHWPILVLSQYWAIEGTDTLTRGILLLMSFACAWLSWRYVESPFRAPLWKRQTQPSLVIVGAVICSFLAFSVFSCFLIPGIQPWIPDEAVAFANATTDTAFLIEVSPHDAARGDLPRFGSVRQEEVHFLVWGDSHAMAAMPVINDLCCRMNLSGAMATFSSTPPLVDFEYHNKYGLDERTPAFADSVIRFVHEKRVRHVFLIALWENYHNASQIGTAKGKFGTAFSETISRLRDAGATVSVMLEVPQQKTMLIPRLLARQSFFRRDVSLIGVSIQEHCERTSDVREVVTEAMAGRGNILDPSEFLVNADGFCSAAVGDRSLYRDNHHLTVHGAMQLEPMFRPIIERTSEELTTTIQPPIAVKAGGGSAQARGDQ